MEENTFVVKGGKKKAISELGKFWLDSERETYWDTTHIIICQLTQRIRPPHIYLLIKQVYISIMVHHYMEMTKK